jgi:hypothetical protein
LSSSALRKAAKREKNALVVRGILAIALVLEGADGKSAAPACDMDRHTTTKSTKGWWRGQFVTNESQAKFTGNREITGNFLEN